MIMSKLHLNKLLKECNYSKALNLEWQRMVNRESSGL